MLVKKVKKCEQPQTNTFDFCPKNGTPPLSTAGIGLIFMKVPHHPAADLLTVVVLAKECIKP